MPPTRIAEPVVTVKNLLKAGWDPDWTFGLTPDFSTGWWQLQKDVARFKVTVTPGDEFEELAGLTSDGPAAFWDGSVDVNVWASRKVPGTNGLPIDNLVKKLIYSARQEVDRIIRVNQTLVSGLLTLRPVARRRFEEDDGGTVIYRWLVEVNYKWIEVPA